MRLLLSLKTCSKRARVLIRRRKNSWISRRRSIKSGLIIEWSRLKRPKRREKPDGRSIKRSSSNIKKLGKKGTNSGMNFPSSSNSLDWRTHSKNKVMRYLIIILKLVKTWLFTSIQSIISLEFTLMSKTSKAGQSSSGNSTRTLASLSRLIEQKMALRCASMRKRLISTLY